LLAAALLSAQLPAPSMTPTPMQPGSVPLVISETGATTKTWTESGTDQTQTRFLPDASTPSARPGLLPRLRQCLSGVFRNGNASAPAQFTPEPGPMPGEVIVGEPHVAYSNPPVPGEMIQSPASTSVQSLPPGGTILPAQPDIRFQEPPISKLPAISTTAQPRWNLTLNLRFQNKVSHAPDFSSVTGQLFYLPDHSGTWVLRFDGVQGMDAHGGHLILCTGADLKDLRAGDLVTVHGTILNDQGAVQALGATLYRADQVQLVERGRL
jgi:hypothetical protein